MAYPPEIEAVRVRPMTLTTDKTTITLSPYESVDVIFTSGPYYSPQYSSEVDKYGVEASWGAPVYANKDGSWQIDISLYTFGSPNISKDPLGGEIYTNTIHFVGAPIGRYIVQAYAERRMNHNDGTGTYYDDLKSTASLNVDIIVTAPLKLVASEYNVTLSIGASTKVALTASDIYGSPSFAHDDSSSQVALSDLSSTNALVAKKQVTFTATKVGVFPVKFTVDDSLNGIERVADTIVTFTVIAPLLTLTADNANVTVPIHAIGSVNLTASTLLQPEPSYTCSGAGASYVTTFVALSSSNSTVDKTKVNFLGSTEGVFPVTFTVTDTYPDRTASTDVTFTVIAPPLTLVSDASSLTVPIKTSGSVILSASTIIGTGTSFIHNGDPSYITLAPIDSANSQEVKESVEFYGGAEGVFPVRFTVTDSGSGRIAGDTASTDVTFTVTVPPLTLTSDKSSLDIWVKCPESITLTAETLVGSSVEWTHNGDSSSITLSELPSSSSDSVQAKVTFNYTVAGVYTVTFTAKDVDSGRITDTVSTTVTITVKIPELKLVADPNPVSVIRRRVATVLLTVSGLVGDSVEWSHDANPKNVALESVSGTNVLPTTPESTASSSTIPTSFTNTVAPDFPISSYSPESADNVYTRFPKASVSLLAQYPDEGVYTVTVIARDMNSGRDPGTDTVSCSIPITVKPIPVTCARDRNFRVRLDRSGVLGVPDIVIV